ncbi:tripartite tricarboxylate transporter TctB family protein [Salipiger sp. IMCC34102]|uniref:tripartite tricarboxylate transporter TctB family protein n=1 Tax=Salipiger sp. IMCC34102 TaxID=2510647 RepID=UPI00101CEED1|nr:tripartite tricarboxylate transporter TctB family protein [Salipiger sp. IMCC34102]RYH04479.1 tripartite tricarboxylate transporter TctB family protein [Salipiger sp. IMCC34102]
MTRPTTPKGILAHSDTWIGIALVIFAGAAATRAAAFDPISRSYPLVLAVLLGVFGAGLIIRVAASSAPKHVPFALPAKVAALATVCIVLWIYALASGLGFVVPTMLLQLAFLTLCGVRPLARSALYAALITAGGYLAFVEGLGVRLPQTIAPWVL